MNQPLSENNLSRRNPTPGVHIHLGRPSIVLLTVATQNRRTWLANETANQLLRETWSEGTAWMVGDYLLMPDHLHVFCAARELEVSIETWISYWKREFRLKHRRAEWKFQSRGWHHRLRDRENYSAKWIYVQENPVRKGLVTKIEDWPFKGRVFDLSWSANQ